MDNAKKALPGSENRSHLESHNDSGIYLAIFLTLPLVKV